MNKVMIGVIGAIIVGAGLYFWDPLHLSAMVKGVNKKVSSVTETRFPEEILFDETCKLANNYIELAKKTKDIKNERAKVEASINTCTNAVIVETAKQQIVIYDKVLEKLETNKQLVKERLSKYQEYKALVQAKVALINSMEGLRSITSVVGASSVDGKAIISSLDKKLSDLETEFSVNEEFKNMNLDLN